MDVRKQKAFQVLTRGTKRCVPLMRFHGLNGLRFRKVS